MQNDELRKAQEELEESRSKYSDLFDFAPVGYLTITEKGLITEANLTGADMLGVERQLLIDMPLSRFIDRESQDDFYRQRLTLLETKKKQHCELKMKRQDGSLFWAVIQIVAKTDDADNVLQVRATLTDITNRKKAEEKLKNAHDKLKEYD